ncbi:SHOCT domain-containing protein [Sulfurimonas sp.]|uniref:SHOCT domain-containing protein n=1 Tax=Sulfurimonas sp. TaxID=2022749 RepID=UPI003563860C
MKKTSILFISFIISIIFIGCTKTPYKAEEPLKGASLVYVYVVTGNNINDTDRIPYYEVEIDGHLMEDKVYPQEFLKYNLKTNKVEISAIRSQLEKQTLNLNLIQGKTYYLRVTSYDEGFGKFDFELVPDIQALKEIKNTRYAIPEEGKPLDILITKEKLEKEEEKKQPVVSKSKTEKIRDAHKLKEDGIITQQEFEKLKAEIINAD